MITDNLLIETLDSKLDIKRNNNLEQQFNKALGNKVFAAHTKAMYADHMSDSGLHVLRVMTNDKSPKIEYHLVSSKHPPGQKTEIKDSKSILHAINIINDDASYHLSKGRSITIHSPTEQLHDVYQKFAKHLLKRNNMEHKTIKSSGNNAGIYSTLIESPINKEKINLHESIIKVLIGEK